MKKDTLWIASFQFTSPKGIKAFATCVEGQNIKEALETAEAEAVRFQGKINEGIQGFITIVTDIGIADPDARVLMGHFWEDPINNPDPDLFV